MFCPSTFSENIFIHAVHQHVFEKALINFPNDIQVDTICISVSLLFLIQSWIEFYDLKIPFFFLCLLHQRFKQSKKNPAKTSLFGARFWLLNDFNESLIVLISFFFSCCWGGRGFGGWGDSSIKSWFVSSVYLVKKIEDLMFLMCLSSQVINWFDQGWFT